MSNMNFGQALEALKKGALISREGWNGTGMYLFQLTGDTIPKRVIHDPLLKLVVNSLDPDSDTFSALPSIRMKTADNKILTGWLASQTDMFADDWGLVAPQGCVVFTLQDGTYKALPQSAIVKVKYGENGIIAVDYTNDNGEVTYLLATDCIGCFDVDACDGMQPNP